MFRKRSAVYPFYVFIDLIFITGTFCLSYIIRFSDFTSVHLFQPSTWINFEFFGEPDIVEYDMWRKY